VILHQAQELLLIFLLEHEQLIEQLVRRRRPDERVNVDVDERGHDHLTVEAIHEAAVTGDGVSKIFDFKGSLKSAGEKAAKRSDRRRKNWQSERVNLKRMQVELQAGQQEL